MAMAAETKGPNYIGEAWDYVKNYRKNKEAKNAALEEIEAYFDGGISSETETEKPKLPDAPAYERMEYIAPTDEQIKTQAEKELENYKATGEKGVNDKIDALSQKYDAALAAAKEKHEQETAQTEQRYETAKKNTDNDMLKRGLARSSIAALEKAQWEKNETAAKEALSAAYLREADELNGKIADLSTEREQALNDFNLAYAARLTERIDELSRERDEKRTEALKYNNSLTEKEYNAAVNKQMKESDLYSEALSQREKEQKLAGGTDPQLAAYHFVAEKLRSVNRNDARDIVLYNEEIRLHVGDKGYAALYAEFCR